MQYRKFEEIVVEYPSPDLCTYPEYKGKPYFGIKYLENENHIIGYGTYNPKVLSDFLKEYFMPRWISVSEKLPEENGGYLVTVKRGYVTTALWVGNTENWKEVTAWMPLPEPYKAESEKT